MRRFAGEELAEVLHEEHGPQSVDFERLESEGVVDLGRGFFGVEDARDRKCQS